MSMLIHNSSGTNCTMTWNGRLVVIPLPNWPSTPFSTSPASLLTWSSSLWVSSSPGTSLETMRSWRIESRGRWSVVRIGRAIRMVSTLSIWSKKDCKDGLKSYSEIIGICILRWTVFGRNCRKGWFCVNEQQWVIRVVKPFSTMKIRTQTKTSDWA